MTVEALSNHRPDCGECGHPMDPHFADGGDAGCFYAAPDAVCECRGYRYPWEVA